MLTRGLQIKLKINTPPRLRRVVVRNEYIHIWYAVALSRWAACVQNISCCLSNTRVYAGWKDKG